MKQWAVKLTLDYGLADHAHKKTQTLLNRREVQFYPQIVHPYDPCRSQKGKQIFERTALGGKIASQGNLSLPLFLPKTEELASPQLWTEQLTDR